MKHILLLEDDSDVSSVLTRLLEEDNYYVSVSTRAADAIEMLARVKVDLLVSDVLVIGGTAFAAVAAANQREVPYFLITGSLEHMAEFEANGEFHLAKPFKLAEFLGAVRDRIGRADDEAEVERAASSRPPPRRAF